MWADATTLLSLPRILVEVFRLGFPLYTCSIYSSSSSSLNLVYPDHSTHPLPSSSLLSSAFGKVKNTTHGLNRLVASTKLLPPLSLPSLSKHRSHGRVCSVRLPLRGRHNLCLPRRLEHRRQRCGQLMGLVSLFPFHQLLPGHDWRQYHGVQRCSRCWWPSC